MGISALTRPADRLAEVAPSKIRKIFDRASQIEAAGQQVLHFEVGRPDFDTPQVVKAAASAALDAGRVHYGPNAGTPRLRQAISEAISESTGVHYDSEDEVIVTIGANEAVSLSIMAFCNADDEVIIPVPSWPHYEACARLAGATPVFIPLKEEDDYRLDPAAVETAMTERTRFVVACTPQNPTGAVLDRGRIEALADLLRGTDTLLLADEIYGQLVYDDAEHISPAAVADLRERTLTVDGFAKAYAMDGWRLGWLAGPRELIGPALTIRQFTTTCPPTFVQDAAVVALTETGEERAAMRAAYAERRRVALEVLAAQDVLRVSETGGAFYLYLSYPEGLGSSEHLAMRLLEEKHIALVPGTAFDPLGHGEYSLRLSYASSLEDIREGLARLIDYAAEALP